MRTARTVSIYTSDVLVKHIPVIVPSGHSQANEARLMSEGAAAFVTKSEQWFEKVREQFIASDSDGGKRVNQSKRIGRHGGAMIGHKKLRLIERLPFLSPLTSSLLNRVGLGF